MREYKNSDMRAVIDEYIHNPRHRDVLRLKYCDNMSYKEIGDAVGYSWQHIKAICKDNKELLFRHL